MPSSDPPTHCPDFTRTLAPFLADDGLPLAQVVSAAEVAQAFAAAGVTFGAAPHAIFTPALTLWAFWSQVIDDATSCRAVVLRVTVLRIAWGREPCAEDTAASCRARARLPVVLLRRLALDMGRHLEQDVPTDWLWQGQHVQFIDGTTVPAPETPANQQAYPQSPSQQPGLGFSSIRLVVLWSLAPAALLGMAAAPYQGKETGETA